MTNKLRQIAESKGRELFLVGNYDFKHGLCAAFETERAANEAVDLINRSNDPCIMGVTEKSVADKLAAALKVACDAHDTMRDAALLALDCDCLASERLSGHKTNCQVPHIEYKINQADEIIMGFENG